MNMRDIRVTEYNVQHIAHNELSKHYNNILGEVKIKPPGKRGVRLDLVVFDDNGDALFSVEVKRDRVSRHTKTRYYEEILGVPNYIVGGIEQALDAYNCIQRQIKQ